ncbi:MAG: DUF359 domain-containing protein [Candidatus Altiarchaeales archaeon]|nr:DUF359 domain-containing protein [Candidatus Altiarchaeales archaeon]MBD3415753.1 DUF359 domain-containing protein [Candidatus Altiarchaeales archaeon]
MELTPRLREELKKPLGDVVTETSKIPVDAPLICVGDTASDTMLSAGYKPKLLVYDGRTGRHEIGVSETISSYDAVERTVANPPGKLEEGVFELFREVLDGGGPGRVYVEGEEDLTALAAIREAAVGSVVVYGQPGEGLVVVDVNEKTKNRVNKIIEDMEDGS